MLIAISFPQSFAYFSQGFIQHFHIVLHLLYFFFAFDSFSASSFIYTSRQFEASMTNLTTYNFMLTLIEWLCPYAIDLNEVAFCL